MTILFWSLLILLVYSYLGYGVLISIAGRLRRIRRIVPPSSPLQITLLIAAHNEGNDIARRLDNALELETGPHELTVLVVSDGSTDNTVSIVKSYANRGIQLIDIPQHYGKISALNTAVSRINTDVVVFSDANTHVRRDALLQLLQYLGDPEVGGICGQLTVPKRKRSWLALGESLFWAYDQEMKRAESRLSSAISAQGSLYAIRRELLSPLPTTACDDLINSLRVVACGKRLVYEPKAVAEEEVSSRMEREFGRRVRSTEQGWRGIMLMSELLNPFRYGIYSLQLFSHKVLRRLNPFMLVLLFAVTLCLLMQSTLYSLTFSLQAGFYLSALLAWKINWIRRVPGLSIPLFFVMGHMAMGLGVWKAISGALPTERWSPVRKK